jgi:protein phosphatase
LLKAIRADEPGPEADAHWIRDIQDGDYFLLCSDGLLENISDSDVAFLLQHNEHREMYLATAFRKYCYNKTRDNYSMYLIRVSPEPAEEAEADPAERGLGRRIAWLLVVLAILLAGAAFVIRENFYSARKPDPKNIPLVIPTQASAKDTLSP